MKLAATASVLSDINFELRRSHCHQSDNIDSDVNKRFAEHPGPQPSLSVDFNRSCHIRPPRMRNGDDKKENERRAQRTLSKNWTRPKMKYNSSRHRAWNRMFTSMPIKTLVRHCIHRSSFVIRSLCSPYLRSMLMYAGP